MLFRSVDTGLRAQQGEKGSILEAYKPGTEPATSDTGDLLSARSLFTPSADVERAVGAGTGGVY